MVKKKVNCRVTDADVSELGVTETKPGLVVFLLIGGGVIKISLMRRECLHFSTLTPRELAGKRNAYKESLNYSQIYCNIL